MHSNQYQLSPSGIWTRPNSPVFNYSDGDEVENRLLRQLQEADDVSLASDELQRLMVDWPSEYHFTPLRANLLSPFSLEKFTNILEIGSGCGAITRLLGEQCTRSKIIALEGSPRRAEITKTRCRDLNNITVCQDSFSYFECDHPFDLVTMIGVLEYSPSFFEGKNPVVEALKRAYRLLDPNGVLIIAIENQLGLKYFNGCAEDHNGIAFSGINDLYPPGTVRTFGKKHLQHQVEMAGFNHLEFVYPFPDYKLPQLLLREEAFQCDKIDLSYMPGQYSSRDYGFDGDKIFQEARTWNLLHKNGLVRDFANSFLMFAFKGNQSLKDITGPWLAKAFSGRRKKRYLIETVFSKENDEIVVDKKVCHPIAATQPIEKDSTSLVHHTGRAKYIKGVPYGFKLTEQVTKDNPIEELTTYLTPWMQWLHSKAFYPSSSNDDAYLLIPGELYDCVPSNFLISDQNQLCIIDQEWEYRAPLEFGFLIFRGLYSEFSANIEFFEQINLFNSGSIHDVIEALYHNLSLSFDLDTFNHYLDLEAEFQLEVVPYNTSKDGLKKHIRDFFTETRTERPTVADFLVSGGLRRHSLLLWQKDQLHQEATELGQELAKQDKHIGNLAKMLEDKDRHIRDLSNHLAERDNTLASIFNSSSWRLTTPLRLAGYLVKGDFKKAGLLCRDVKITLSNLPKRFSSLIRKKTQNILESETCSASNLKAINTIVHERCEITQGEQKLDPLTAPPPELCPPIDISIVTFNSEKWINEFIDSLVNLEYPDSLLTFYFVDNGSTDSTVDALHKETSKLTDRGSSVQIIEQKNKGYGSGHNRAIQAGSAPFVLVSNIDLTFAADALQQIISTALADDENAAAWELRQKPYEHPKFYDPVTGTTNWNSHACVLFRRRALEKVGFYDETLFMYGEDVELSYRLRQSGALLRYCPHAVVHHFSYDYADQIKPLQYSGSTFANLYLRLKYGHVEDIKAIPFLIWQLLSSPEVYTGSKRDVRRKLLRLLLVAPKTLLKRKRTSTVFFPFYTWDYDLVREGAFVDLPDMPDDPPLVTIITRTYKGREQFLRQALLSVAHQTYPNIEHIVVEDGGAFLQPVVDHIGQLTGRPAIFIENEKLGRSSAGNVGLANAKGRWCLFLDDDDLLFAEHIETLVSALTKAPDAVAAYSPSWEVETDDSAIAEGFYTEKTFSIPSALTEKYNYETLKHHNLMAIQSVLFERQLFEERGGFDTDLDVLEDWVLWLCYGYENRFIYVPKVTSMFRTPFNQEKRNQRQTLIDAGYGPAVDRANSRIDAFSQSHI